MIEPLTETDRVLVCTRCGCEWHSTPAQEVILTRGGCLCCDGPLLWQDAGDQMDRR